MPLRQISPRPGRPLGPAKSARPLDRSKARGLLQTGLKASEAMMRRPQIVVLLTCVLCSAACLGDGLSVESSEAVPRIDAIDIDVDDRGTARFSARASDPSGGPVIYAWGTRALTPPAVNAEQIVVANATQRGNTIHLVVQGMEGLVAAVAIEEDLESRYRPSPVPARDDDPCVVSHGRCIATCRAASSDGTMLNATCGTDCAVGMALCRADPA